MEVKDLIPILYQKNTFFQVESTDPSKQWSLYGRKSLQEILDNKEYGSLEAYLNRIATGQKKNQLRIRICKKNGGGFLPKEPFFVNVVPNEKTSPVNDTTSKTDENKLGKIEPVKPIEEIKPLLTTSKMENIDEKLKAAEDRIELRFLKEKYDLLKKDFEKCDAERKDYIEKNLQLTRDIAVKVDQKDIDHKRELLAIEKGEKGGLKGIIEDAKEIDPDTLLIALGTLMPNHPMVKARAKQMENEGKTGTFNPNKIEDAQILDGIKHENAETQAYIEEIYNGLIKAPSGKVGMIGSLFGKFMSSPNDLATAFKHFFPKEYEEMKNAGSGTGGANENEEEEDN